METMPEPMTTVHDAGGIASSNCFTRGAPGTGDGPAGPSRLRLTALVCRDSRFMVVARVATFRRAVPLDDGGPDRVRAGGGLPGKYPDRTSVGWRRRACDQVITAGQSPPDALVAGNFGLGVGRAEVGELGQQVVVRFEAGRGDLSVAQPGEAGAVD